MVDFTGISQENGYMSVCFEGHHERFDLKKFQQIKDIVLAAIESYTCNNVLLDYSNIHYKIRIIDEYTFGKLISQIQIPQPRIAVLAPNSITPHRSHLENVAINRGANLRVFFNRDEAEKWLLNS